MDKWIVQSSSVILDVSPWLTVTQQRCLLPDGTLIPDYNIISAPHIVIIFALTADQQVVLVRQYKHGAGEILLELPGGLIEDESPLINARRELREETGYDSDNWQRGATFLHNPTREDTQVHHFIATNVQQVAEQDLDPTESIDVVLMPLADVMSALHDGHIRTTHTIAAIYHSLALLNLTPR